MLFVLMIPVSIIVKLMKETGLLNQIAPYFVPVMGFVGLPGELAIVWVSTMLTGLYGGMLAFSQLSDHISLSAAQATVLTGMMLSAHAMVVELRICNQAGVRAPFLIILRIGFALVFGALIIHCCRFFNVLQYPAEMVWNLHPSPGWRAWIWGEIMSYIKIFGVVTTLIALMRLLDSVGLTRLLKKGLRPILRPLGISSDMGPLVVVGMTLGLAYGGGLIVEESHKGHIKSRDLVMAIAFMSVCHSMIEDTIIMMMFGGHIAGVLWLRIGLALVTTWVLYQLIRSVSDRVLYQFFAISRGSK
jgi:hypothetical protein